MLMPPLHWASSVTQHYEILLLTLVYSLKPDLCLTPEKNKAIAFSCLTVLFLHHTEGYHSICHTQSNFKNHSN